MDAATRDSSARATATLLVELLTEELPPKSLKTLAKAFADRIVEGLAQTGLSTGDASAVTIFATPRRLGVSIAEVLDRAADRVETKKLMPAKVAYDASGAPTAALIKRLEKEGADASSLSIRAEAGVDTVWLEQTRAGVALAIGLQQALDDAIAKLPVPKRMTYQRYDEHGLETTVQFVRPAHALVAMHGGAVVPVHALGIHAGNQTSGHRFIGTRFVALRSADEYAKSLRDDGKVIANLAERREEIRERLLQAAGDDRVVMPDALLDEVTALVEWPVVYRGTFDPAFLDVPQECLILTMQQNQKYFALTDAVGTIVNRFLVVSNIETTDPSEIIGGNERVLRARLADAKFFYDQDRKKKLEDRVEGLKTVVYHNKLGTQYERMERVEALAGMIAGMLGIDANEAKRAAHIAKADLLTDMVGEFPELQGLMGRYYALHDGEQPDVAAAIEEQYRPRFAGDALPATQVGVYLALADKLETLAGMFSVGAVPTGDKDPFALRRHALGVVRVLMEKDLRVDLDVLVGAAVSRFVSSGPEHSRLVREIFEFIRVRAAGYGRDLGYSSNEVEAVLYSDPIFATYPKRWAAVSAISSRPEFLALAAANKRVGNILKKSEGSLGHALSAQLLSEPAERSLHAALTNINPRLDAAIAGGDFLAALLPIAELREPVDAFFDTVMVNVDDQPLRNNRLALLAALQTEMNRVADLSKLVAA